MQCFGGYVVGVEESSGEFFGCMNCSEPLKPQDGWIWVGVTYGAGGGFNAVFKITIVGEDGTTGETKTVDVTSTYEGGCSAFGRPRAGAATGMLLCGIVLYMLVCKHRRQDRT